MQSELGREVRDGTRPQHAGMPRAPGVFGRQILLKPAVRVIDTAVEPELRGPFFEHLNRKPIEQRNRVVSELHPQRRVELPEQLRRVVVPAPPQIFRQCSQPLMRGRDELTQRPRFRHDRRDLAARRCQQPDDVFVEPARLDSLDDEHTLEQSAVDDGNAEEGMIRILTGFSEVLESRVGRGVSDHLGLQLFRHEAG